MPRYVLIKACCVACPPKPLPFIEGLALQTPPRTIAAIHRQVCTLAQARGWNVPSYDSVYRVIKKLDPDLQVQASIREVFRSFAHTGSAFTTVRHFRQQHLLFPRRLRRGAHRGELVWADIEHHDVLRLLHHPAYAGAYVYGRSRTTKTADGKLHIADVPRADWVVLVVNSVNVGSGPLLILLANPLNELEVSTISRSKRA